MKSCEAVNNKHLLPLFTWSLCRYTFIFWAFRGTEAKNWCNISAAERWTVWGGVSEWESGGGAACPRYKTTESWKNTALCFHSEDEGRASAAFLTRYCFWSFTDKLFVVETNMSHVDVKNLKPTSFEDEYYDEYEYYNLTDKYAGESSFSTSAESLTVFQFNCWCWCCRGLGPERQDKEGGQWKHQQTQPRRARAQDRGKTPEQREESQGVNTEVRFSLHWGRC